MRKEHRTGKRAIERVRGLTELSAERIIFHNEQEARDMSVAEYFAKQYHRLQYPNLPCLDVGNDRKPILLPLEVCT